MIVDLVERYGPLRAKYGVVFLDEIDKLAATKGNEYRASYNRGTQHSLLKLIEGTEVQVDGGTFSTENILFIYGGAFTAMRESRKPKEQRRSIGFERCEPEKPELPDQDFLPEDFVQYGMGARGLNALVEEWVEPILMQMAEGI